MSATPRHAHAAHVPSASANAVRYLMFDSDGGGMRCVFMQAGSSPGGEVRALLCIPSCRRLDSQMRAYRAAVFVVLVRRTHLPLGALLSPPLKNIPSWR
jgi:hypothetical protein